MRIVRRVLGGLATLLAVVIIVVALIDTFGGRFLDGPLGPIPGGKLSGPVSSAPYPPLKLEKVVELEIRPERPWSLNVWNVVLDGQIYVPSARGERRRWTAVAVAEPLVRLRTQGEVYELRIEKVTDPELREQLAAIFALRYGFEAPDDPEQDTTWYFRLTPRS